MQDPLWACSMMSQGTRSRQVQDPLWACDIMSQGTRSYVVQDLLWACGMMSQGTRSCEVQDPLWACSQMSQDTTEHLYMLAGVGFWGVCVIFVVERVKCFRIKFAMAKSASVCYLTGPL